MVKALNLPQTIVHGLTGDIKFDNQGYRTVFAVDIVELTSAGVTKIGTWNSTDGLSVTRIIENTVAIETGSLRNKTFIVLTTLVFLFLFHLKFQLQTIRRFFQSKPYGMLRDSATQLTGNDRYEGFRFLLFANFEIRLDLQIFKSDRLKN